MVLDSNSLTITHNLHSCFHHNGGMAPFFMPFLSAVIFFVHLFVVLFAADDDVSVVVAVLMVRLFVCTNSLSYLYVQTLFHQLPFSFLCRINHNLISFWHRRNIHWISLYLFSRACHGLLLCHSRVFFVSKPMFSTNHWNPTMASLNSHRPACTEVASTLFGSVQLSTPLLVDLERIQGATDSSLICFKPQNLLGIVPSFWMDAVCVHQVMFLLTFRMIDAYWNAVISANILFPLLKKEKFYPHRMKVLDQTPLTVTLRTILETRRILVGPIWWGWWRKDHLALHPELPDSSRAELLFFLA